MPEDERPESDPKPGDGTPSAEQMDAFVRLLGQHQRRVFLFVMSMVPNWSDAEEIVQETNLVLWREFESFQAGTNFAAWACRVALNQALAWRKRRKRDRLEFSDAFLEAVAAEAIAESDRLEERSRALSRCVEKLPEPQRVLLRARYDQGRPIDAMSQELGRSVEAIYRALSRIRHSLHDCVTRTLSQGELA